MHFIFGLRIDKQQQSQRRTRGRGRTRLALGRAGAMSDAGGQAADSGSGVGRL